ncbi:MAG: M28 family peptidase [Oscillospiraceae bacterium]|nr:M28 family peptidase [Oscillospiraceae bacterium]
MIREPMDVLKTYPVRKTKKQKQAFRDAVCAYVDNRGYPVRVEKTNGGVHNIVIGDPENASYLVTAHYDTCAAMFLPNFITPCNPLLYWGYQILVMLLLIIVSVGAGVITAFLWPDGMKIVALMVYWVLLLSLLLGPANKNNANDNTSGVVTLLEILRSIPENQRHKVCFVLFDLEEMGLIGSASYRKVHKKATDNQLVLNLDCVGDGDEIRMFPTKKLKKNRKKLTSLYKACGYFGSKNILIHEKGASIYPSDQMLFPYGVGICALKKGKAGLYLDRIHTKNDTILEQTNVNLLRAALTTFICGDAAQ